MYDLSKDFDYLLDDLLGFGKPTNIKFNSGKTKDMMPAYWTETDDGYKAVCRTVGIDAEDVVVEQNDGVIKIHGNSEYEGHEYSASFDIPISDDVLSNIVDIRYKTLNGLTYIYLKVERPEKKKINISRIK